MNKNAIGGYKKKMPQRFHNTFPVRTKMHIYLQPLLEFLQLNNTS